MSSLPTPPTFSTASTVLTALLAVAVTVMPLVSRRRYRRMAAQRERATGVLERYYLHTMARSWSMVVLAEVIAALSPGFGAGALGLRAMHPWWPLPVVVAAGVATALPGRWLRRRRIRRRGTVPRTIDGARALLPGTRAERRLAVPVAFTAGTAEEIVYRGFLVAAGRGLLHLPTAAACLLAVAVFGWGHIYQGWAGVAGVTVAGALLMCCYVLCGSLVLGMAGHVLIDLVALLGARPPAAPPHAPRTAPAPP